MYIWFVFDIDNALTAPRFPSRTLITGAHRCQFPLAPNLSSGGVARSRRWALGTRRGEARRGRPGGGRASGTRPLESLGSIDSPRGLPATRHLHAQRHAMHIPLVLPYKPLPSLKPQLKCDLKHRCYFIAKWAPLLSFLPVSQQKTYRAYLLECLRFAVERLDIVEVVHWSDKLAPAALHAMPELHQLRLLIGAKDEA